MFDYEHRQIGLWWLPLLALAGGAAGFAVWGAATGNFEPGVRVVLLILAATLSLAAASLGWLDVRDEGYRLSIRFGPLPVFGTAVPYDDIESAEPAQLMLLHGFGMNVLPGLFISFRVWGSEVVKLRLRRRRGICFYKTVYVGTDDAEGLLAFLRGKLGRQDGR
jgi:hypothetical protein